MHRRIKTKQTKYRTNAAQFVHTLDDSGEAREFFKFETKSRVSRRLIRLDRKNKPKNN